MRTNQWRSIQSTFRHHVEKQMGQMHKGKWHLGREGSTVPVGLLMHELHCTVSPCGACLWAAFHMYTSRVGCKKVNILAAWHELQPFHKVIDAAQTLAKPRRAK
eukprot:GHVT01010699.1.p1 GENE.GHVT01010699.1~~GHVT01010699.1.p1  ORF type:complete len:104 (-),score=3.91 GHVT01010699.1:174-485(-)